MEGRKQAVHMAYKAACTRLYKPIKPHAYRLFTRPCGGGISKGAYT
jgi:hypothetical protein